MRRSHPAIEPLEARIAPASFSISNPTSIDEGNSGTKTLTFQVTLEGDITSNVTVAYATGDGTATQADNDYVATAGLLTFTPTGAKTQNVSVTVIGDTKFEGATDTSETFLVSLFSPSGATITNGEATGTIKNDDAQPTLTVTNGSITEGQVGDTHQMTFTLSLSNPSSLPISVDLSTIDGTGDTGAISTGPDADFVAKMQSITFAPGETSKTFTVDVNGDATPEKNETFKVGVVAQAGSLVTIPASTNVTGTIVNDDKSLNVTNVKVVEGTPAVSGISAQTDMVFTIVLDRAGQTGVVTVDYTTLDGTALAGANLDYITKSGTLTFAEGETTKTVTVKVNQDNIVEADETLTLHLSNASGAGIVNGDGIGTITNDEVVATLSIEGATGSTLTKFENEFSTPVKVKVHLSQAPTADVVLNLSYSGTAIQAGSTAATVDGATVDYDTTAKTTITIPAGQTDGEFIISVVDDSAAGVDENINITLSSATNGILGSPSTATINIKNDDAPVLLTVADVSIAENDASHVAHLVANLSGAIESDFTFQYSTVTGTAGTSDFTPVSNQTITIKDGQTSASFDLTIADDTVNEGDETFKVHYTTSASHVTVPSTDTIVTILDNDPLPTLSKGSDINVSEGNSGTSTATFQLSLSEASGREVKVRVKTVDGTAVAGQDYTALDQVITFAPGETSKTVSISILGDKLDEADELFTVELSEVQGASLAAGSDTVQGKIKNDDLQILISGGSVLEGNVGGTNQAKFTISLSAPSAHPVDVTFDTENGTAISGTDYVAKNGIVVHFNPGETSKDVFVDITGDTAGETAETFFGKLSNSQGAQIGVTSAQATILNDDAVLRISDAVIVEGGPGATGKMVFTVTLENGPAGPVTVDFATNDQAATHDSDYTAVSGTLTFAAGETSKTIEVPILGDSTVEGTETFEVKLSNVQGMDPASALKTTGTGTILDDEGPIISIANAQIVEGDNGTSQMIFVVNVSGTVGSSFTLHYSTIDGTATSADYTGVTDGTLTISSTGTQTISVPIKGDVIAEGDQTFSVHLTSDSNSAAFLSDTATGTIQDNDVAVVSVSASKTLEGNSGQNFAVVTVSLNGPSEKPVTIDLKTLDGTATAGSDYTGLNTTVSFAPGQTSQTILVPVLGDTTVEADETFKLSLSNPSNATVSGTAGTVDAIIQNDDILATVDNITKNEADGTFTVTVKLSQAVLPGSPVTVNFAVAGVTATLGTDFQQVTTGSSITITSGTTGDITFKLLDDTKDEANETFTVKLTDATNAAIGDQNLAAVTIVDNDAGPTVSIVDQYVFEGDTTPHTGPVPVGTVGGTGSGTTTKNVAFTIKLSAAADYPITVLASTIAGTALDGSDFVGFTDQQIVFAAGETSKTVTVGIFDDQAEESVESFKIKLSSNIDAAAETMGTIQIVDNDLRGVSISDASIIEGANGTKNMTFTVSLSSAATQVVTVLASTVDGTAVGGSDFVSQSLVPVVFQPGETSKTFTVQVNGDAVAENDESFTVHLTGAENELITDADGTGKILTDEITYSYKLGQIVEFDEGNTGQITREIIVVRNVPEGFSAAAGDVVYSTVDGTAVSTGNAPDFSALTGTLHFAQGGTSEQSIFVKTNGDSRFEGDETFSLKLTSSTNGLIPTDGSETLALKLKNDDARPTLSISGPADADGVEIKQSENSTSFVFTVKLSAANDLETTAVTYFTQDGTAVSTAIAPHLADFTALNGTLIFAPGETSKTITVTVNNDDRYEADETFSVKLGAAKSATDPYSASNDVTITDNTGDATIQNDDAKPVISFTGLNTGGFSIVEGNSGETLVKLKVKLSNPSESDVTVNLALDSSGTANNGVDYTVLDDLNQAITFAAGETEKEVTFRIVGDTLNESNETIVVKATGATNADIANTTPATITITNDDPAPALTISDASVLEGGVGGTAKLVFTVSISGASDKDISVDFSTFDGTAVVGGAHPDYLSKLGTITFAAGDTAPKTISVDIVGDDIAEGDETLTVKLSNATNASIARSTGTGTILDDGDTHAFLTVGDAKIVEGDSGTSQANFVVQLSHAVSENVTFHITTRNGTAVAGSDYTAVDQTFTITAGLTSVNVPVTVTGDTAFEATENFFVSLSGQSSNAIVDHPSDAEGRGTIYNNDIQFVNGQTAQYIDGDGDLVTIKITKGVLTQSMLVFQNTGSVGGRTLTAIDFTGNPSLYNGTSVSVTADQQPGFVESGGTSDGKVNVGVIYGSVVDFNNLQFRGGIDFQNVTIEGDLGGITAGDQFVSPAIRGKLTADSFGTQGTATLPSGFNNIFYFLSTVNSIQVEGDVFGSVQAFGGSFGSIHNLSIGGGLRGDISGTQQAGRIAFSGTLGNASIGKIVGGSGESSGAITSLGSPTARIGTLKILDDIAGGSGASSGSIEVTRIGKVTVGDDVTGGAGASSGRINASVSFGSITIGGDVTGGSGQGSGQIAAINGNSASIGTLSSVTIKGNLAGGSGNDSGQVVANASIGNVTIEGAVTGSSGTSSGSILTNGGINSVTILKNLTGGSVKNAGVINAGAALNRVTIGSQGSNTDGDMIGGAGENSGSVFAAKIGTATIYGSLKGSSGKQSAVVSSTTSIGTVKIADDVVGGTGDQSAQVFASQSLGRVTVDGSVTGGDGDTSAVIFTNGTANSISIAKNLTGGAGQQTGIVYAAKGLSQVTIGTKDSTTDGHVVGGSDQLSGIIRSDGNLGKATIYGSVRGGTANTTGVIQAAGEITSLTIRGNLEGGSTTSSQNAAIGQTGFVTASRIAQMTVEGNIVSGQKDGSGALFESGAIRVTKDIAALVVKGDVTGNANARVVISGGGTGTNHLAIGNLSIAGNASYLDIVGGYTVPSSSTSRTDPLGQPVSADAQIKQVVIDGNVLATNIVAGVRTGPDGRFGTNDDVTVAGTSGVTNDPKVISTIGAVTIKGAVQATTEAYGIVAQYVKKLNVADFNLPVTTTTEGDATTHEVQKVDARNAATFQLTFGGKSTAFLPSTASAADVQAALSKFVPVTVGSTTPGVFDITYTDFGDKSAILAKGTQPALDSKPGNNGSGAEIKPIGGSSTFQVIDLGAA